MTQPDTKGFVPEGKVWVQIHGLYADDLFEVDATTPALEIADAKQMFKIAHPGQAVFIGITRITHKESQGRASGN